MRHLGRKVLAALAILAGLLLAMFETVSAGNTSAGDTWFWYIVAALTVLFGLAEFVFPDKKK